MNGTRFSVEIQPRIPERLSRLEVLVNDLYYSWSRGVRRLFRHLDEDAWEASGHNPKIFLRRVSQHRLDAAAHDPILLAEYRRVLSVYDTYMEERPVSRTDPYLDPDADLVAYFSAEFGFHESVPLYAGGLGILAGDYCKAMSNLWMPFTGIGLLYRQGYFTQHILCDGEQDAKYPETDSADLPVTPALDGNGNELAVRVTIADREVELKVWEARVGQIRLYLLDSDVAVNTPSDRAITAQLYGGDSVMRLEQEIVLGIGGVRALRALGLAPTVWHINEGHAAFLILERTLESVNQGMDIDSAFELTAANTVFTTHTPVPAGHDVFGNHQVLEYLRTMISALGVDDAWLLALGSNPRNPSGFCMTSLAMRGSSFRNGVSSIHGRVTAEMESYIWPEVPVGESPIRAITNGVDVDTFLGLSWVSLFDMYMGGGWRAKLTDTDFWNDFIDKIPDHVFLSVRQLLKGAMLEDARNRATIQFRRSNCTRSITEQLTSYLNPSRTDILVIGFARRFATYKRATLLFTDLERLARLVNDPEHPVLFLFAGKAHPNDIPGQQLLKKIYEITMRPEFLGRILLLEDYNLSMARELTPGVDVWLNSPEYPMEACGTSGMKAAINGALNLSVLDGWWAEAFDGNNGWAITPHPDVEPSLREQQEAVELMNILEYQVIPTYFSRNANGEQEAWVRMAKASMKTILPRFNSIRMAMDYVRDAYGPAARLGRRMSQEDASGARELAAWKKKVASAWPNVRCQLASPAPDSIEFGQTLSLDVSVHLNGLVPEDIIVECIQDSEDAMQGPESVTSNPLKLVGQNDAGDAMYHCDLFQPEAGTVVGGLQYFRVRVYPWHPCLNNRFECGRMIWL
mgnify:FL=1